MSAATTTAAPVLAPSGVTVRLPRFDDGGRHVGTEVRELNAPGPWTRPQGPITSRIAFAAAHVVPQVGAENVPGAPAVVDWDATLAYRHRIWEHGLGVADAMDTAQRGMGLDWAATQELVRRSAAEAASVGARVACGAGTDQLDPASVEPGEAGLAVVTEAYREQVRVVQEAGAQVIVMASRALAKVARSPEDYARVYDAVLAEADRPVVLHWLGTMFDPALAGYWGSDSVDTATATFLDLIKAHQDEVDGVKVSLLDAQHEIGLRRSLAALEGSKVRLYTGDDFNYPELIAGDDQGYSDALLGIFAAIYPAASTALQAFDAGAAGDAESARLGAARGHAILASTEKLGRHIFAAPTYYYKTGIAFLSWLNGFQPGFQLVGGLHAGRSLAHLVELARLADGCGMLLEPDVAARRLQALLTTNGVHA